MLESLHRSVKGTYQCFVLYQLPGGKSWDRKCAGWDVFFWIYWTNETSTAPLRMIIFCAVLTLCSPTALHRVVRAYIKGHQQFVEPLLGLPDQCSDVGFPGQVIIQVQAHEETDPLHTVGTWPCIK